MDPLPEPEMNRRARLRQLMLAALARFRGEDPETGETDYWGRGGLAGLLGMAPWYDAPPQEIAEGFAGAITPAKGAALLKGVSKPIRAYHGSPHDFDKFDLSKIGTGEGAQAYGHGLYFAENEGVARGYRDALSHINDEEISSIVRALPSRYQGSRDNAHRIVTEVRKAVDAGEIQKPSHFVTEYDVGAPMEAAYKRVGEVLDNKGRMYEVDINADPAKFLDWDRPLAKTDELRGTLEEQARRLLSEAQYGRERNFAKDAALAARSPDLTGEGLYKSLSAVNRRPGAFPEISLPTPTAASQALRDANLPGIKYLDGTSRGSGTGTSNYVVFDDSLISILRKYGLAGLIGGGAAAEALPAPESMR